MNKITDVEVTFIRGVHGTNYNDKYLRGKNVNTYFFKNNLTGEKYRWEVNNIRQYYFDEDVKYKISANLNEENEYGIRITYTKIKKLIKNTYGDLIWVDYNQ